MLNQASFILIDSALERGPQEYNGSIWVAGITMTGEHRGQSVIQYSGTPVPRVFLCDCLNVLESVFF
jgi:hypothetical protein